MKTRCMGTLLASLAASMLGASCYLTSCFVRGTKILTPKGPRRIEDLVVGDEVYSFDVDKRTPVVRCVAHLLRAHAYEIFQVAAGELVIAGVTAEHPFYDAARREWTTASTLTIGTRLVAWLGSADVREIEITAIHKLPSKERIEIFNLTIDGPEHNYFAEGLLVHNKEPPYQPPPDDHDGDGWGESQGDCDDTNPSISPSVQEFCSDGIDNDCDGQIDANDNRCPCTLPSGTFAMDAMFFGETDRNGTLDLENGWKQYGTNMDHSVAGSPANCKPVGGASLEPDGIDGIDNSFGRNIVPILREYFPNKPDVLTSAANDMIKSGKSTLFVSLTPVDGKGCGTVETRFYHGWELGKIPQFDGTDAWPIDPALLHDPADPLTAKNMSTGGGIAWDGRYQSNLYAEFDLRIEINGASLVLPIHFGDFSMRLALDGSGAADGQLWGTVEKEKLVQAVTRFASTVDPTLCDSNSTAYQTLAARIRQAADVLSEGNAANPAVDCSNVSIGIGFSMKPAQVGNVSAPIPPPTNSCPP